MEHKIYNGEENLVGKRMTIIKPGWCLHDLEETDYILLQGTITLLSSDFVEVDFDSGGYNHAYLDCILIHGFPLENYLVSIGE